MPKTIVTIIHPESEADMNGILRKDQGEQSALLSGLSNYFMSVASGNRHADIDVKLVSEDPAPAQAQDAASSESKPSSNKESVR